jgi:hypothetical protein
MGDNAVSVRLKKEWKKSGSELSLRKFARKLISSGENWVQSWFDNKDGVCNQSRADKTLARIKLEREATKVARRKNGKKEGGAK